MKATSSKPFIEQIPERDRQNLNWLASRGYKRSILWTRKGWRYSLNKP